MKKIQIMTMIRAAQMYLNLLYKRYEKHLIGPEAASDPRLNQDHILDQMKECSLIFTMRNLYLNDLTDSRSIEVSKV